MVGANHPVFGIDRCTLDQWQQVALHPRTRDFGTACFRPAGNLVDFIKKYDAVLLDIIDCHLLELVFIEQFAGFFFDQ